MAKGFINNEEDLRRWFDLTGKTKWNLYRGHLDKMMAGKMVAQNKDEGNLDSSFDLLMEMIRINSHGGGYFTVYVPVEGANTGRYAWIQLKEFANSHPAIAGIRGNAYSMGMLPIDQVEEKIQKALKIERLERQIEDLEAEREASEGVIGSIVNKAIEDIDFNNVANVLMAVCAKFLGNTPATQLNGFEGSTEVNPEAPVDDPEDLNEKFIPLIEALRQHFSNEQEFYQVFNLFVQKFSQNPKGFVTLLTSQN